MVAPPDAGAREEVGVVGPSPLPRVAGSTPHQARAGPGGRSGRSTEENTKHAGHDHWFSASVKSGTPGCLVPTVRNPGEHGRSVVWVLRFKALGMILIAAEIETRALPPSNLLHHSGPYSEPPPTACDSASGARTERGGTLAPRIFS